MENPGCPEMASSNVVLRYENYLASTRSTESSEVPLLFL